MLFAPMQPHAAHSHGILLATIPFDKPNRPQRRGLSAVYRTLRRDAAHPIPDQFVVVIVPISEIAPLWLACSRQPYWMVCPVGPGTDQPGLCPCGGIGSHRSPPTGTGRALPEPSSCHS